jgi:hypothetical protein
MEETEQIERIKHMETLLNLVKTATEQMELAERLLQTIYERYSLWEDIEREMTLLEDYYHSDVWKKDFEDDEAGRLPKDLKRGVLSEDGIWDAVHAFKEMKEDIYKRYPKKS